MYKINAPYFSVKSIQTFSKKHAQKYRYRGKEQTGGFIYAVSNVLNKCVVQLKPWQVSGIEKSKIQ